MRRKKVRKPTVRHAQAHLRAALEQLPAAVLMVEAPSGRLVLANRATAALFGQPYPLPCLHSKWTSAHVAFRGFHRDGRPYESAEWPLARSLAAGETVTDEEIGFTRADGSHGVLSVSSAPVHDARNRRIAAIATCWDISQRARAEAASRDKDDLVAMVGHELRTPLTAILLWVRMLRDSEAVAHEEIREAVASIERAARAQQQLVDDLLDVSRISSGTLRLAVRPVQLQAAIEGALEAVRPAADARGVVLENRISAALGTVQADPGRLRQIVWNLLNNAVKFTPAGGRVQLTASREDSMVVITVSDNGSGIPASILPRIFDRFTQGPVDTRGEQKGLGLGLTIARQLAELHGGSLVGESAGEGKGATFTVRLPLPADVTGHNQ